MDSQSMQFHLSFMLLLVILSLALLVPPKFVYAESQLLNISTSGLIDQFGLKAGFIVRGSEPRRVVVFGERQSDIDPVLQITSVDEGVVYASNNDWQNQANAAEIVAVARSPGHPLDAALITTLAPGAYVASLDSLSGTGYGLVSIIDLSAGDGNGRMINISTGGWIDAAGLNAGFIIDGDRPKRVVVAGENFSSGIDAAIAVTDITGNFVFDSNSDWRRHSADFELISTVQRELGLPTDAGVVVTLAPGTYVARLSSENGIPGRGIVSVNDFLDEDKLLPDHYPRVLTPALYLDLGEWRWSRKMYFTNTTAQAVELYAFDFDDDCRNNSDLCRWNIVTAPDEWSNGTFDWQDCLQQDGRVIIQPGSTCADLRTWRSFDDNADSRSTHQLHVWYRPVSGGSAMRATSPELILPACEESKLDIEITPNPTPGGFNRDTARWEWAVKVSVFNRSTSPVTIESYDINRIRQYARSMSGDFDRHFDGCSGFSLLGAGQEACTSPGYHWFDDEPDARSLNLHVWYRNADGSVCGVSRAWEWLEGEGTIENSSGSGGTGSPPCYDNDHVERQC